MTGFVRFQLDKEACNSFKTILESGNNTTARIEVNVFKYLL